MSLGSMTDAPYWQAAKISMANQLSSDFLSFYNYLLTAFNLLIHFVMLSWILVHDTHDHHL